MWQEVDTALRLQDVLLLGLGPGRQSSHCGAIGLIRREGGGGYLNYEVCSFLHSL